MKLITLSGVDGSGKSTQIKILESQLQQEGRKIFYFHAIEFSAANIIVRFLKRKKSFVAGQEKANTQASWLSLWLRILFLFVDIFRFRDLARKLEKAHFDFILSDRYFYDSFINIKYLALQRNYKLALLETLERYIPNPDNAFYLDISPEEIIKRERTPEQGEAYLREKIALFNQYIAPWKMYRVDASQDRESVSKAIRDVISR